MNSNRKIISYNSKYNKNEIDKTKHNIIYFKNQVHKMINQLLYSKKKSISPNQSNKNNINEKKYRKGKKKFT